MMDLIIGLEWKHNDIEMHVKWYELQWSIINIIDDGMGIKVNRSNA